jgi:hypothetical protein
VLPEEEEVRRRFRAVRTQVGLLARVGTRRRTKAGREPVWRSNEALDTNIVCLRANGERGGRHRLGCLVVARS